MRRGCRLSFSLKAFAPTVWSCLNLGLWGKLQQDLKVFACHSVFFVHNMWQVVAWDTSSKIHLEGLVVYEKHCLLWQSALCCLLFVICFKLITSQPPDWWGSGKHRIQYCSSFMFSFSSIFTSWPHQVALFQLQSCTYSSQTCIFHFGPWNIEALMQHLRSHADFNVLTGLGWSRAEGLIWRLCHLMAYLQQHKYVKTINQT